MISITLTTTMGPGIRVDSSRVRESEILSSGTADESAAEAAAAVAEPPLDGVTPP